MLTDTSSLDIVNPLLVFLNVFVHLSLYLEIPSILEKEKFT